MAFKDECRACNQSPDDVLDEWKRKADILTATRKTSGIKAHDVAWADADRRALANLERAT